MANKIVIIFDFDRTLIDDDSDRWVICEMGLAHLYNQLRPIMPWTSLMDRMVEELHSQGRTTEEIAKCLQGIPLHQRTAAAIKSAHSKGCDLKVVSDANKFYIETVLKHHGLLDCFSEIITNPSTVDEHDRLRIYPYHDINAPHGCTLCPPNMCKGLVFKRFLASLGADYEDTRFIYLGDGGGDFCPALKLGKGDHVMPRKNFPLCDRINSNPELIEAGVHEWSNGEELEQILLRLIDAGNDRNGG
ncbi:OLC1v1037662C1 [Oldenlandia corymbosa var. corymbosa]|uniref:OLC1v1037662C1 n=1 Tax=Oldenlandia corymbosa var. corymbosa TaxID=529605 RepID=A0AAV1CZ40_OLDCO|nr:OLC1v1037662C1 [Oldenlandia corymbosa var. corymbosa]